MTLLCDDGSTRSGGAQLWDPRKLCELRLAPGQVDGRDCQPEAGGVISAGAAGASSLLPERTLYN